MASKMEFLKAEMAQLEVLRQEKAQLASKFYLLKAEKDKTTQIFFTKMEILQAEKAQLEKRFDALSQLHSFHFP